MTTATHVGLTSNAVFIAAPRARVWEATNDVTTWPELFSEYAAAEVLETDGPTVTFRLTMHPDDAGIVWSWVSQRTPDPATHTVEAHRVEPGPFEFMHIHWSYDEVPGGTLMRWEQRFRMNPSAPVGDAAMTDQINANTRVQMDRIKSIIERSANPG